MFGDFLLSEYLQIDISTFRNQNESSFYFRWLRIPFLEGSEFLWTVFFLHLHQQPAKTNGNFQISPYSEFSYTYMYFEKVFSSIYMYFEKVLFFYDSCHTFLFKPRFHQFFLIFNFLNYSFSLA